MTYLLQVSTCWVVFYGIYLLFLRKETFFSINRYYLLGALLSGLFIPFLGGFIPANQTSTEVYSMMNQISAIQITPLAEPAAASPTFSWSALFIIIYILGVTLTFSRLLYGLHKIYRLYAHAEKSWKEHYLLVESSEMHLPFSFFQCIFISKKLPLNDDAERILKHEKLHVYQWHSLDILITELLQVFFWFNPILIFYKNALRQAHEYLADAYVTRDHNRSSYGQLLLRQSTSGLEIALANHFFHSQIKKRITMMYQKKSRRSAMIKYLAAIPVLVGLLVLFASNRTSDAKNVQDCHYLVITEDGAYRLEGERMKFSNVKSQLQKSNKDCVYLSLKNTERADFLTKILKLAEELDIEVMLTHEMQETQLSREASNTLPSTEEGVFRVVEEMPRFPGCESMSVSTDEKEACAKQKMLNFIYQNLKYPKEAAAQNIEGTTVVQFTVEKDGSITNEKVVRQIGGGCEEAVKNILSQMPNWIPGRQKGQAVRVQYTLPVVFKLTDDSVTDAETRDARLEKSGDKNATNAADVFKVVEEMPRFPGCEDIDGSIQQKEECAKAKLLEYIYTHIKYPKAAKNQNVEGVSIVKMIIEKDGSVSSTEIVRDPGAGIGQESKRVIEGMPQWIPGKQNGQAVRVQYVLPISYKLTDDSKEVKKSPSVEVDLLPLFPGTDTEEASTEALLHYVFENVQYPKQAARNGIEGTAIAKFTITKDGLMENINIVKSPGWGIEEAMIELMDKMRSLDKSWVPAKIGEKSVNYEYTLPVKFKLEGDELKEAKNRKLELKHIRILPNPSDGVFTMDFDMEDKTPVDITFYTLNGQVIKKLKAESVPFSRSIDLSSHPRQTLLVNITQNDRLFTDKIIIQ